VQFLEIILIKINPFIRIDFGPIKDYSQSSVIVVVVVLVGGGGGGIEEFNFLGDD